MRALTTLSVCASVISAPVTQAQERGSQTGWIGVADGFVAYQGSADLSAGGSFSATRAFLRGGGIYRFEGGNSAGVLVTLGGQTYNFDGPSGQPWGDIRDLRVSLPVRLRASETTSVFIVPSLRYDYENGASAQDGQTYGVFAGLAWKVNEKLTIGPAAGVFSELGSDEANVFPAILVDWDISDKFNLSTGGGLGATQGPGLTLTYKHTKSLSFSLGARYEEARFRLDNSGPAPNGVGRDRSIPVIVGIDYAPSRFASASVFVGAELDGELSLEDAGGAVVSRQSYDAAPLAGFLFRFAF